MAIRPTDYFNELMNSEQSGEFKSIVEYSNYLATLVANDAASYFNIDFTDDLNVLLLLQDYFYEHTGTMFLDDLDPVNAACFYVQRLIENDEIDLLVQNPIALQLVMIDFLEDVADLYSLTLFAQYATILQDAYFTAHDMSYLQYLDALEDDEDESSDELDGSDDSPCPCGGSWCKDSSVSEEVENNSEAKEQVDEDALRDAAVEELADELIGFMEDLGLFQGNEESKEPEEPVDDVIRRVLGIVKDLSDDTELVEGPCDECDCELYDLESDDPIKVHTLTVRIS